MPAIDTQQFAAYRLRVFTERDLAQIEARSAALKRDGSSLALKLATKLDLCCRAPMIYHSEDDGDYHIHEARCKSRICPRCARFRAYALIERITECVKRMDAPRFLTLTVRSTDEPLRDQLINLRRHFANLRRSPLWKRKVTAGVYAIEVTINRATRRWHPHIHAIIDGTFFEQAQLLQLWEAIVGDHAGVDIRKVNSASQTARYIASYVSKTSHLDHLTSEALAEWAVELHGMRLAQTFGTLHGVKVVADPEAHPRSRPFEFDLNTTAWMARAGCRRSDELLRQLTKTVPKHERWSPEYMLARIREHPEGRIHQPSAPRPPPDQQLQLHAYNASTTGP